MGPEDQQRVMSMIPLNVLLHKKVLNVEALLRAAGTSPPIEVLFHNKLSIPKIYDVVEGEIRFASAGEILYSQAVANDLHPNQDSSSQAQPVETLLISNPVPPRCSPQSFAILEFMKETKDHALLETKSLEIYAKSKWYDYGKRAYMAQLVM